MSGPDRNAPCPCGSGKKSKKCCAAPGRAADRITAADIDQARRLLEALIDDPEQRSSLKTLADRTLLGCLDRNDPLVSRLIDEAAAWRIDWISRQRPDGAPSLAARLAETTEVELSAGARAYLRALDQGALRLFEIGAVHPGSGVTLWDLLDDRQIRVFDRALGRGAEVGTYLAARLLPIGPSGRCEVDLQFLVFPATSEAALDRFLDEAREIATERAVPGGVDEVMRRLALELFPLYVKGVRGVDRTLPAHALKTLDGDPMVPTRVRFRVSDPAAFAAALSSMPALESDGPGVWHWRDASRGVTGGPIGKITLEGDELTVECLSAERGARLRALLEALPGAVLDHLGTESRSLSDVLAARDQPDA
jgi:hypothetical protein